MYLLCPLPKYDLRLVLVCQGCLTNSQGLGGLTRKKETRQRLLTYSSGGQNASIRLLAGSVPSENCEGEVVPCLSPSFRWFVGNLCWSLAYSCKKPICALFCRALFFHSCVCVQTYPFYKDTANTGSEPTIIYIT